MLCALWVAWAACCAQAEVGAGASPTSQAIAADAQFLEYAPPPAQPGVVCLVDSGVDPNPDTTPALAGAESLDPSWGTGDGLAATQQLVGDHPNGHGTEMAMLMAAPQNGWGMVGIAPTSVRVYSIRVVAPGGTTFPIFVYGQALSECAKLRGTTQPWMTVVNLSLGGATSPSAIDASHVEDAVNATRQDGLNVVAAAGNGGSVTFPASSASVFAVGAGDAAIAGALCEFSPAGSVDIVAPGCNKSTGGIDEAFEDDGSPALGFGTSQAAALTSAVLAAMRAYEPTLSHDDAENCLTTTEVGGVLDAASAFKACGLERVVEAGEAATPTEASQGVAATEAHPTAPAPSAGTAPARLVRPRVAATQLLHDKVVVSVLNRPRGASVDVHVVARRGRRLIVAASRTAVASRFNFTVGGARLVRVRFVVAGSGHRTSAWISKPVA